MILTSRERSRFDNARPLERGSSKRPQAIAQIAVWQVGIKCEPKDAQSRRAPQRVTEMSGNSYRYRPVAVTIAAAAVSISALAGC
jgi:hypothetical protein